jgi:hypothetical protein
MQRAKNKIKPKSKAKSLTKTNSTKNSFALLSILGLASLITLSLPTPSIIKPLPGFWIDETGSAEDPFSYVKIIDIYGKKFNIVMSEIDIRIIDQETGMILFLWNDWEDNRWLALDAKDFRLCFDFPVDVEAIIKELQAYGKSIDPYDQPETKYEHTIISVKEYESFKSVTGQLNNKAYSISRKGQNIQIVIGNKVINCQNLPTIDELTRLFVFSECIVAHNQEPARIILEKFKSITIDPLIPF